MNVINEEIQALQNTIAIKRKLLETGEVENPVKLQGEINILERELLIRLDKEG